MVFTYISYFRSSNGLTAWPDLVAITQLTLSSMKNANGEQNWATSASSQTTCQYIRTGHLPTMIIISATELSNFLCKRLPQATHAHTEQLLCLRWHYTNHSPRLLQSGCIYYTTISLASHFLLSLILLLFIRPDRLFRVPPSSPMPALLLWKSLPRMPAFLQVALNKLCYVFPPPGFLYSSSCRKK